MSNSRKQMKDSFATWAATESRKPGNQQMSAHHRAWVDAINYVSDSLKASAFPHCRVDPTDVIVAIRKLATDAAGDGSEGERRAKEGVAS